MNHRPGSLADVTELTLRPRSDWHIGAGHGLPGSTDALVRRDRDRLPYVPGTTITGLLRDACATVAGALDGGEPGVWARWHVVAFGQGPAEASADQAPVTAAAGFGAARLAPAVRREILADPALAAATTTVRVGVAIDDATGRAADDMLRTVELARGGLSLRAAVTLRGVTDPDARAAVTALLVLGAAWCDRMGGDRRRGPGEVDLQLAGQSAQAWATWLTDTGWTPPPPAPVGPAAGDAVAPLHTGTTWTVLDLRIVTETPLRVPAAATGNMVRGLDHLPGAALLAWLSDRWGEELVRAGVAGEAILVRHAHPEVDGRRGVPVPLTTFRAKDGTGEVSIGVPDEGMRQVRDHWTVPDPTSALPLQRRSTAQVGHNTIDRDRQRPVGAGGVYELEVIPAGRVLRGEVLLAPSMVDRLRDAHGDGWPQLLAGPARFGSRRGGEYGGCAVTVSQPAVPQVPPVPSGGFRLWLVSDAVVLGPGLRPGGDPRDLASALAATLGVPDVSFAEVTARTRRRDGWQGRWQRPRDSLVGLGAGSVVDVVLPPGAVVDADGWASLSTRGLGERCVEGFGEVLLDAPLFASPRWTVRDSAAAVAAPEPSTEDVDPDDRGPLDRLRRTVRRERIAAAVATSRGTQGVAPLRAALRGLSPSQRGSWRAVTADGAVTDDLARVRRWAADWQENRSDTRRRQRAVAEVVAELADDDATGNRVDRVLALDLERVEDRAFALAALVADVVTDLAGQDEEGNR